MAPTKFRRNEISKQEKIKTKIMKRSLLVKTSRNLFFTGCMMAMTIGQAQETIIYQQNFDGNNGNFTNGIVSQNTPTNGWLSSSTAPQYGEIFRHMWNFSDVTAGGEQITMPISGRSLGMGFFEGNVPFIENHYFYTYAGDIPTDQTFYTTRWAHVGISTEGFENITVEFKWRCAGEVFEDVVYDYGTVNTSIDGGATWAMDQTGGLGGETSEHGIFTGGLYYGSADVQTTTISLPTDRADQPNFRLAFRMVVDEGYGTGGGFIIDDIIIRGDQIELGTEELNKSSFTVYKDGNNFVAKSTSDKIQSIEVFDLAGRKAMNLMGNAKQIRIPASELSKGVYIIKAKLENGDEMTQKILK